MGEMKVPYYREVRGILMPGCYSEEACLSAINYKPKPNDLFVVTYPKCGTTWMQHIVTLILRRGKPFEDGMDFFRNTPFLEMAGADAVQLMTTKGALKLHLPFHLTPFYPHAKYIYVARNPRDCCVSLYHHNKQFSFFNYADATFDDFFDLFVNGKAQFGDYFDHLIAWYDHRNDENVYFVTYEKLKRDTKQEILNLARFIGEEYEKDLKENPKILQDILYYTSFDYMKKHTKEHFREFFHFLQNSSNNDILPSGWKHISKLFETAANSSAAEAFNQEFIRKGVIGDWKNYFTEELEKRMNQRIIQKTKGSDVMNLWENI